MGCLPVHGENPRALAGGLSYVQVDKPAHHEIFCAKVGKGGKVHNKKIHSLFLKQNICCGYSREPSQ